MQGTPTDWPRKRGGFRRRASTPRMLARQRLTRPTGWGLKMIVLLLVAGPSLLFTSPSYIAFAARLPAAQAVSEPIASDTMIYASDGTTLLADLHAPGYQHYYEPLSAMGEMLPKAMIAIEDRNFYSEPGIDPSGVVRASMVDWRAHET